MKVLKLFSVLLDYPKDELWENSAELIGACADDSLSLEQRQKLKGFVQSLLERDKLDVQSKWIELFDRGRFMSLLLFEHIHGESRDRGQAMVDLVNAYREKGFEIDSKELPDYLPLILEFLSLQDKATVDDWLKNISKMLALLAARAKERQSPYRVLFEILAELSGKKFDWLALAKKIAKEKRDDTPQEMDKVWMEEQVRFGPDDNSGMGAGAGGCNSTGRYDNRKKIRIASQMEKK